MPRWLLLTCFGIVVACGSRTGLFSGALESADDDGGGDSGGDSRGDAGPPGRSVAPNGCTARLLAGAPTPMQGYCPTRTGLTSIRAPQSPSVAWSTSLVSDADPANFLPAEIVVDTSGRIYVAVNSSPLRPGRYEIDALDPDGSLVWKVPFEAPVSNLTLAADGTLWALSKRSADAGVGQNVYAGGLVVGVTRDGATKATYTPTAAPPGSRDASCFEGPPCSSPGLGAAFSSMVIGADGSFFLSAKAVAVARMLPNGTVLWGDESPALDYVQTPGTIWLTPADDIVSLGGVYHPDGREVFEAPDAALIPILDQSLPMAMSNAGEIFVLSLDDVGNVLLEHISLSGEVLGTFAPGSSNVMTASQVAVAADGTVLVLLANELRSPGQTQIQVSVVAIAQELLTPRWTTTFEFPLEYTPFGNESLYTMFVDLSGTIVVTGGTAQAIDLATGKLLWNVAPPHSHSCVEPGALGAGGAIVVPQCDGSIFLARDP
jgi:hypothetical protein